MSWGREVSLLLPYPHDMARLQVLPVSYDLKKRMYEPVLAWIEDTWQIAFLVLVERIEDGHVVVFVPDALSPWSGFVFIMTTDRIKALDIPVASALKCIKMRVQLR